MLRNEKEPYKERPPYMQNPKGRIFITTDALMEKADMTPHWPDGEPKDVAPKDVGLEVVMTDALVKNMDETILAGMATDAPVNEKGNPFKDPNKCSRAVLAKRAKETFGVILDKTEPIETVRAKYKALEEAS